MSKPQVAVIMGGMSAERAVSLESGACVLAALERLGYPCWSIDYGRDFVDRLRERAPAAAFVALHGGDGEDGTVQAVLDAHGIPYQGSGQRASALALDKWATKALMRDAGLATPPGVAFDASDAGAPETSPVGYPAVVKPRWEGSAIGVSIVRDASGWAAAVKSARGVTNWVLAESYVRGREFTVAVLGDGALPVIEIRTASEFYDYGAKYAPGGSTHVVPAHIPADLALAMQRAALRLHGIIGCRDYSRTDILVDEKADDITVLEINTVPGFTPTSLYPDAARAAGIDFDTLVERLVSMALTRTVRA